jgi:hypothetical protein
MNIITTFIRKLYIQDPKCGVEPYISIKLNCRHKSGLCDRKSSRIREEIRKNISKHESELTDEKIEGEYLVILAL